MKQPIMPAPKYRKLVALGTRWLNARPDRRNPIIGEHTVTIVERKLVRRAFTMLPQLLPNRIGHAQDHALQAIYDAACATGRMREMEAANP